MSASLQPMTQTLWLSWPTDEAMAPRLMPKPLTKPCPTLPWRCAGPAPPPSGCRAPTSATNAPSRERHVDRQPVGQDLPGRMPITGGDSPVPRGHVEGLGRHRPQLHRIEPDQRHVGPRPEAVRRHRRAAADHGVDLAAVARSSSSTMSARWPGATSPRSNRPKWRRRRPGGGAIGVERPHAAADGGADQVVDVAFLGDVERVAVVGAERQERRALGRRAARPGRRDPWTPCLRGSGSACPWRASRAPRRPTSSHGSCARRRRCRH